MKLGSGYHRLLALSLCGSLALGSGCTPSSSAAREASAAGERGTTEGAPRGLAPAPEGPPRWAFPPVEKARLTNGLGLQVLERPRARRVEVRLVVFSGSASDGHLPGVAALTARWLKTGGAGARSGRELLERIEALGGSLAISTTPDATVFSLRATGRGLEPSLALLSSLVREPRFPEAELDRLKRRELSRRTESARSDAHWLRATALHMELFRSGAHHPYAVPEARPHDLAALDAHTCRAWYSANVSPNNSMLIAVGDVELTRLKSAAERHFGAWQGGSVAPPVFLPPRAAQHARVVLVDRPGSIESALGVAVLGPERQDARWSALRLATHMLGVGSGSRARSALERADARPLAVGAELLEYAYGPTPMILSASVPAAKTGVALAAMLSSLEDLAARPPTATELARASGALAHAALLELDTPRSAAGLVTRLGVMGLSEDYYDRYRVAILAAEPADVQMAWADALDGARAMVVVGDAERLLTPLSRFGQVDVVRASDFRVQRVVTRNPRAPLDLPEPAGG